jgi:hypothetical protein
MKMKTKWIRELLGLTYIYNRRSKEIHDTKNAKKRCHQDKISKKNRKYITARRAKRMMQKNSRVNGCRYCMPEFDKG